MAIQWFPGHMTRTKKLIKENLKNVDVVIEILDARAPLASRNPLLKELTGEKPRLVILNKNDLADPAISQKWVYFFEKESHVKALALSSKKQKNVKAIVRECKALCKGKKWMSRRAVRAMIIGIPNVGKSTIINSLAGKVKAKAANQPGVTRNLQRVPVTRELQIFDTPGILWHKFDDPLVGLKLASLGSIKDAILHIEDICYATVGFLSHRYPKYLKQRYNISWSGEEEEEIPFPHLLIEEVGQKRGFIRTGGVLDYERTCKLIIKEFREGILGAISLEAPLESNEHWILPESSDFTLE